jgi:SAM-dependent MidA family methyltransferase
LTNEHQTFGGNIMQLVEMGPGTGVLLNQIIEVGISIR